MSKPILLSKRFLEASSWSNPSMEEVKVLAQEDKTVPRKIREAVHIHKRKPELNRDQGLEIPPVLLQLATHDPPGHVTHH